MLRVDNNRTNRRMFNTSPEIKRGTGRPKLRWGIVWTMILGFYDRGIIIIRH
jgi:hypothetical protein